MGSIRVPIHKSLCFGDTLPLLLHLPHRIEKKKEKHAVSFHSKHFWVALGTTRATRVFAGTLEDDGEENKLKHLVSKALHMIVASPEDAEDIIAGVCRDVDAWVANVQTQDGRVTMDLLSRIQRGEFFTPQADNIELRMIQDEIVDKVGEMLTLHYMGYDFGSLDQGSLPAEDVNQLQSTSRGGKLVRSLDLELLEEQARALEATMGVRKAQSIVQLLGRKSLTLEEMSRIQNIPEKSDAERVLEALMYVDDRQERRALMQEAFIPVSAECDYTEEQEAISTTPMALYQQIVAWQGRCKADDLLLEGIAHQRVGQILEELRDDVFDSLQ